MFLACDPVFPKRRRRRRQQRRRQLDRAGRRAIADQNQEAVSNSGGGRRAAIKNSFFPFQLQLLCNSPSRTIIMSLQLAGRTCVTSPVTTDNHLAVQWLVQLR